MCVGRNLWLRRTEDDSLGRKLPNSGLPRMRMA